MTTKLFHHYSVLQCYKQRKLLNGISTFVPNLNCCQDSKIKSDKLLAPSKRSICMSKLVLQWKGNQVVQVGHIQERVLYLPDFLKNLSACGTLSVLKPKDVKQQKINYFKRKRDCFPNQTMIQFQQPVILREHCDLVYSMSASHFSTQVGSGDDLSDERRNPQENNEIEAWEKLVDYSKLSPTEKKIHERHRNAVKVEDI